MINSNTTFRGYRRENGRVGIRNHVIVLPVDDLSNSACEAVAHNIKGAMAIPHPYGRLQFGADLDLHFRTLIGAGSNPNVAAVIVIGIEEGWTKRIVDAIAKTGKPVTGFGIELHGARQVLHCASQRFLLVRVTLAQTSHELVICFRVTAISVAGLRHNSRETASQRFHHAQRR